MNKTILITGASSGFGKATAHLFAKDGWNLILAARRQDRLESLQQELAGASCHLLKLDVRDRETVADALTSLPTAYEEVDVLVNSAGLALGLDMAPAADLDDWDTMVDTNIKGLTYCTRALLPGMVERKRGHIINLGSIAAHSPYPGGNAYGASKAFVSQFSNNLRTDLHGSSVRVTVVEPGLAETEFSLVRFKGDQHKADNIYKNTQPLVAEDVADSIFWAATRPAHVNVNRIELMPVCQSWGPLRIHQGD